MLDAPVGAAGRHEVAAVARRSASGETPTLPASRGFEAMAVSKDGVDALPDPGRARRSTEPDQRRARVYEFDVASWRYTGSTWSFRVERLTSSSETPQVLDGRRLLLIERDDAEGADAA